MGSRVPMPIVWPGRTLAGAVLLSVGVILGACGGGDSLPPGVGAAPLSVTPDSARRAAGGEAGGAGTVVSHDGASVALKRANPLVLDAPPGLLLVSNLRDHGVPGSAAAAASAPPSAVRLTVTALPNVTVGEVNRALSNVGARIVEMRVHDLTFSIETVEAESAGARDSVVSRLEASRLFESVVPVN